MRVWMFLKRRVGVLICNAFNLFFPNDLKSGVDSKGGTHVKRGNLPFPRVLYESLENYVFMFQHLVEF